MYKFQPGEYKKAYLRVKEYFTENELENFKTIHTQMNDHFKKHFEEIRQRFGG